MADAHGSDEEDARLVAVADAPADKVRVCVASELVLDHDIELGESRRVCRVLQSVQDASALLVREVQLTGCSRRDVVCDNTGDFLAEGLNGD